MTDNLTRHQRDAVEHAEGPLLILAGPGSGKTRVITGRIARLIERDVSPAEILAITFTNKAAREMQSRVERLIPGRGVWVGTFHRFCARLLRGRAQAVGLQSNFSILGTTDQRQLVRHLLDELDIDAVHYSPSRILNRISQAKNDLQSAEDFARQFEESIGDHHQAIVARVYPAYQEALLKSNAVDFDDLLMHVVTLLRENPALRAQLDKRFRFVLVDEYQDTNSAQYQIVRALSVDHPNVCVTGDPDQSIYGWRGAKIDNILRFESDYPQAKVVRLEANFRSTKSILRSADSLIAHNQYRKKKSLTTDNAEGAPVRLLCFQDGRDEADSIARAIRQAHDEDGRKWSDFAIFFRVNSLSRELELALSRHRVPYQLAQGVAFYERAEVKDLLAYLRVVCNPADEVSFRRIVNKPTRGIGQKTRTLLGDWASRERIGLLEAAARADEVPRLTARAVKSLQAFARMIRDFSLADAGSVAALLETVVERTRYAAAWGDGASEQDVQRMANVEELLATARYYDEAAEDEVTLEGFLESASLASDVDGLDAEAGEVTLMTLHSAKGLEFPVVYLVAVEQNILPHERSLRQGELRELEEERRLLFVGMTRAEEELYLTQTAKRNIHGRPLSTIPSDFLSEMPLQIVDDGPSEFEEKFSIKTPDRRSRLDALKNRMAATDAEIPLLTTAANLLSGSAESVKLPTGFAVGMTVRHPRYGLGTVTEVRGFSKRGTVEVSFEDDDRVATFDLSRCPLQPVGTR